MNPYADFHHTPDYRTPEVLSISRLPAHTRWGAFSSVREALRGSVYDSSNILLLNGGRARGRHCGICVCKKSRGVKFDPYPSANGWGGL